MVDVRPFQGFYCNSDFMDPTDFISPPYDKIPDELAKDLYAKHNNFIHIVLGKQDPSDTKTNNRYTRAHDLLKEWTSNEHITASPAPCFYLYRQNFQYQDRMIKRDGLIALLKIEELGKGKVFGHERTLAGPKEDRFKLLKATAANFGQLFMLYDDADRRIEPIFDQCSQAQPLLSARDENNITHTIWVIDGDDHINAICQCLRDKSLVVADGHHRYETSVMYRDEQRRVLGDPGDELPSDFTMVTMVNTYAKDLLVLPTHRLVRDVTVSFEGFCDRLKPFFEKQCQWSLQDADLISQIQEFLNTHQDHHAFVVCHGVSGKAVGLTLNPAQKDRLAAGPDIKKLDVSILHEKILKDILGITEEVLRVGSHVGYVRDIAEGIKKITKGTYHYLLCMNPSDVHDVVRVAQSGERMPQKSTDFYPKFYSGLIFRKM